MNYDAYFYDYKVNFCLGKILLKCFLKLVHMLNFDVIQAKSSNSRKFISIYLFSLTQSNSGFFQIFSKFAFIYI